MKILMVTSETVPFAKTGGLADAVSAEFPQYVIFRDQPLPRVVIASLSSEAGIIGAAMLG